MGTSFNALSALEQAGVTEFVRAEYDRLVFQQPASYVSRNAQADPEHWKQALCELIASDPIRVRAILEGDTGRKLSPSGFTLIELSIALVIIGLIAGGILVGQSLVNAGMVRAQISQIQRYRTAVSTFRGKYGYLPGDIKDPEASSFGFVPRGSNRGQGDGNGILEGVASTGSQPPVGWDNGAFVGTTGEAATLWVDLSTAKLIEDTLAAARPTTGTAYGTPAAYMPSAKLGTGNYIYAWSGGKAGGNGLNYFGVSFIAVSPTAVGDTLTATPGLTVAQSYAIDNKIDDGLPQLGAVQALYVSQYNVHWAAGGGGAGASGTLATPGSPTTCYDNANSAGAIQQYSVEISGGSLINCALSFQFQ